MNSLAERADGGLVLFRLCGAGGGWSDGGSRIRLVGVDRGGDDRALRLQLGDVHAHSERTSGRRLDRQRHRVACSRAHQECLHTTHTTDNA